MLFEEKEFDWLNGMSESTTDHRPRQTARQPPAAAPYPASWP